MPRDASEQTKEAAVLCFGVSQEVTGLQNITCPMQQMGHAALPNRAGVRGAQPAPLLGTHKGKFLIWTLAEAAGRRPRKARRWHYE